MLLPMAETPKHEITAYWDLKEAIKKNAIAETQATHDTTFEMNSLEDWYYEKQELISHISHAELQELKNEIEDSDQVLDTNKLSVTTGWEIKYEEQNVRKNETGKPENTEWNIDATIITSKNETIKNVINRIFENLKKMPVIGALIQLFEKFKNHNNATTEVPKDWEQITPEEISQTDTQKDIYDTLLTEASAIDALNDDDTSKTTQKEILQKTCQEKIGSYYKNENSTESWTLIERQKTFTDKIRELENKINATETTPEEATLLTSQKTFTEKQKTQFDDWINILKNKDINWTTATEIVKNTQSYEKEAKKLLEIPLDTWEDIKTLDQAHDTTWKKIENLIRLYTSSEDPTRKAQLYKELWTNIQTLKTTFIEIGNTKDWYSGSTPSLDFPTKLANEYDIIRSRHNALLAKANTIQKDYKKDYKENYGPVDPYSKWIYVYNTVNGKIYERFPGWDLQKLYKGTDNALHYKVVSKNITLNTSVQDGNYFAVPKDVIDTLIKEDSPDITQSNSELTIAKEAISDKLRKLEFNGYNLKKTPETTEATPEANPETTETTSVT